MALQKNRITVGQSIILTNGPSKTDLMSSLFDNKIVEFLFNGSIQECFISKAERAFPFNQEQEIWIIKGFLLFKKVKNKKLLPFQGNYCTKTGVGKVKIQG